MQEESQKASPDRLLDAVVVGGGQAGAWHLKRQDLRLAVLGAVTQVHSSGYRNPAALSGGSVPVVGGDNSGFQIAE
jgi:cation diffusion facilitator CzcD-associated flavoprotein CzcO